MADAFRNYIFTLIEIPESPKFQLLKEMHQNLGFLSSS